MQMPFINFYAKTVLNVNSLRGVKMIVSQNISNNRFTLFLCHIIFLSVHIVIHRYTDIIVLFDYIYVQHFTIVLIYEM
jgi:hypothetical protein